MRFFRHPVIRLCLRVVGCVGFILFAVTRPGNADSENFVYLPMIARPCPTATFPTSGYWLEYVNFYRATACLRPVTENPEWSDGDYKHAIYMVKNDILSHDEDSSNPWYTPEGRTAAQQSNVAANSNRNATDRWAIETWMQGPFHALGIIDPRLVESGYGSFRESGGTYQMAAALNIIAGMDYSVNTTYPVLWPGNGTTVPIRYYTGNENPDPLTSCPGYTAPSGLPLIIQIGAGTVTPVVEDTAFLQNEQPLEHCVFDETTYVHPNMDKQDLGRNVLGARDAIVLIPRMPLSSGTTYTASITVNGKTYTWSFTINGAVQALEIEDFSGFVR